MSQTLQQIIKTSKYLVKKTLDKHSIVTFGGNAKEGYFVLLRNHKVLINLDETLDQLETRFLTETKEIIEQIELNKQNYSFLVANQYENEKMAEKKRENEARQYVENQINSYEAKGYKKQIVSELFDTILIGSQKELILQEIYNPKNYRDGRYAGSGQSKYALYLEENSEKIEASKMSEAVKSQLKEMNIEVQMFELKKQNGFTYKAAFISLVDMNKIKELEKKIKEAEAAFGKI
jgi:hypothetical protein